MALATALNSIPYEQQPPLHPNMGGGTVRIPSPPPFFFSLYFAHHPPATPELPLVYLSTRCQSVLRVQCLAGPGAFLADGFALPFVSAADARPALLNYKQCRMSHHLTLSRTEFKFQTDKKLSTESNQAG